jgi:4a-hydroxytetrahydrobiopterin dehydratase
MVRSKLSPAKVAEGLAALRGWKVEGDGAAIGKQYSYKDHIAALGFVVKVSDAAEAMDHHPEVNWVYNRVRFTLSTHDAGGVTQRDFELAAKIEGLK